MAPLFDRRPPKIGKRRFSFQGDCVQYVKLIEVGDRVEKIDGVGRGAQGVVLECMPKGSTVTTSVRVQIDKDHLTRVLGIKGLERNVIVNRLRRDWSSVRNWMKISS